MCPFGTGWRGAAAQQGVRYICTEHVTKGRRETQWRPSPSRFARQPLARLSKPFNKSGRGKIETPRTAQHGPPPEGKAERRRGDTVCSLTKRGNGNKIQDNEGEKKHNQHTTQR